MAEKKVNRFQNFAESLFSPIGGTVRGALRGLAPGMAEQHDLEKKLMENQSLIRKAQAVALEQGRTIYGGRGGTTTDPLVQAAVDIGKIQDARGKFDIDMPPETAAFFDAAEKSVKARTGFKEPEINPKTGKPRRIFSKEGQVLGTRTKEGGIDNRGYFSTGGQEAAKKPAITTPEVTDYFQASTEVVPEANIPKTFEQLGITTAEDQATFQEMEKALSDVDLRKEFENDPEGMQRLMKLWREKKLNKQNIGKAFSMLQQKAQQSLGILS